MKKIIPALLLTLFVAGCGSVNQTVLHPEKAKGITSWAVVMHDQYEKRDAFKSSTIDTFKDSVDAYTEQLMAIIGVGGTTQTSLIDRIKFTLTGQHQVPIVDLKNADGVIAVSTVPSNTWIYGTYSNVLVRFINAHNNSIIAQLEVENGVGLAQKDLEDMSKLVAKEVAKTLMSCWRKK